VIKMAKFVCFRNTMSGSEAYLELNEKANLIVNGAFLTWEGTLTIRYIGYKSSNSQEDIQQAIITEYEKESIRLLERMQ
jgi:hypothetical protein